MKKRKKTAKAEDNMATFLHSCLLLSVYFTIFLYPQSSCLPSVCKLRKKFHLNKMHKPGDVLLGGLFEVHYTSDFPERTFTSEPQQPLCKGWVSHSKAEMQKLCCLARKSIGVKKRPLWWTTSYILYLKHLMTEEKILLCICKMMNS